MIYETTINIWQDDGDGGYVAYADNKPTEPFPTVITVDYDGTIYRDIHYTIDADCWDYGAVWDISNYTWDFSEYPFVIMYENIPEYGMSISAHVSTNAPHTFKVYVEPQPTYEKIYELTFSDWQDDGDGSYFTDINGSDAPSEMFPNTVTVDWDGVRYKDLHVVGGYQWGAGYDYDLGGYDFSVYPFSFQLYDVGGGLELHLVANSDAEHTFEVYVEVDG